MSDKNNENNIIINNNQITTPVERCCWPIGEKAVFFEYVLFHFFLFKTTIHLTKKTTLIAYMHKNRVQRLFCPSSIPSLVIMCVNNSPEFSLQEDGRITGSDEIGDINPGGFSFSETTTISYYVFVYPQQLFDRPKQYST